MKTHGYYDKDTKTMFFEVSRYKFIPAYLYYLCQKFIQVDGLNIKYVTFLKEDRTYLVDELKGKDDWKEIDRIEKGE